MAVADELDRARAALQMINQAPYNAEAPPEALIGEITPVALHYVRSNFALPAHDGTLEIGGAVENPLTLTLDDLRSMRACERAVTLECAGNGRLDTRPLPIGEPWGDYAVSTASWTGALLHDVLEQASPATDGVDVRFEGADHGAYHLTPVLADTDKDDLTFERALPLALTADPAAEILVAYEMNGEPLGPDHGAPFRLIVPHWYAVASVKWLKRIDVLTEASPVSSRRATTCTSGPTGRTRPSASCACGRASPPPLTARRSVPARTPCAARPGREPGPSRASTSASPAKATGTRPGSRRPKARTSGRTGRSTGRRTTSAGTPSAPGRPMPPAIRNRKSRPGIASATETTPSRSCTSTCGDGPTTRAYRGTLPCRTTSPDRGRSPNRSPTSPTCTPSRVPNGTDTWPLSSTRCRSHRRLLASPTRSS